LNTKLSRRRFPWKEHLFFSPMVIGENPADADNGAAAILAATKTAASAAFWDFPDERIPYVGALSVLLDGRKIPRAILSYQRQPTAACVRRDGLLPYPGLAMVAA
jgi:hypothetical protein